MNTQEVLDTLSRIRTDGITPPITIEAETLPDGRVQVAVKMEVNDVRNPLKKGLWARDNSVPLILTPSTATEAIIVEAVKDSYLQACRHEFEEFATINGVQVRNPHA